MLSTLQAGADACFVEAPRDDEELKEIGRQTNGYRVCNMLEGGITPLHTPEELKAMGFHLIFHPLTTLYASAWAMLDVLMTLKKNGSTRNNLWPDGYFWRVQSVGEFGVMVWVWSAICKREELRENRIVGGREDSATAPLYGRERFLTGFSWVTSIRWFCVISSLGFWSAFV